MIVYGESDAAYRSSGCFGIHAIRDFVTRGPRYFFLRHVRKSLDADESAAMSFGRAAHCHLLEGAEAFGARFVVPPINARTGKPYGPETDKAIAFAKESGKCPVGQYDLDVIGCMAEAINEHAEAQRLLRVGSPEVTVRNLVWQARMDRYCQDTGEIVDLKTTTSLDGFRADFFKYGYDYQAAFYLWMTRQDETAGVAWKERSGQFSFVVVEKQIPNRVMIVRASPGLLASRMAGILTWQDEIRRCIERDEWPRGSYPHPMTYDLEIVSV